MEDSYWSIVDRLVHGSGMGMFALRSASSMYS
jgi:hypothetical protein